ncbi:hypothetical protein L1987_17717 [Smallanthus sonchifolius]|uniref:Uncharacterized protein n=1 Tax=Smallanthus sonchifolius TaxID=185202 RepID=A0ACB9IYJ7_9ASTR|nr:hypothetical protein L1987_17717 [Smallanthus sonchifolius]
MKNSTSLSKKKWGFCGNSNLKVEPETTIKGALALLMVNLNISDDRPVIPMSINEPSAFPCFSTSHIAAYAIDEVVKFTDFNGYPAAKVEELELHLPSSPLPSPSLPLQQLSPLPPRPPPNIV